jgi:hypothetical protein
MRVARFGIMLIASVQLPVTYRCTLRSFFLTMLAWLARRNVTNMLVVLYEHVGVIYLLQRGERARRIVRKG